MVEMLKILVTVLVVVVAVEVSAETHHVVGGDGGWIASSPGRVFRVGDKISFTHPATEETILELQTMEDLLSCNFNNPIRMYTDVATRVTLDKEGTRYFTSANPENCKNGFKLPVSVQPTGFEPEPYWPPYEPEPTPEPKPEPTPKPKPEPEPEPKPEPEPTPEKPVEPPPYWPPYIPQPTPDLPPPPPVEPSASTRFSGFSFVLFAAFAFCFTGL